MEKRRVTPEEYIIGEVAEIQSPLNIHGTSEELGRPVNLKSSEDRKALFEHWVKFGGLRCFRERHEITTA